MSERPPFVSWVDSYRAPEVRASREMIRAAMNRRGLIVRLAGRKSQNQAAAGARRVVAEHEAAVARAASPVQCAVRFLRTRGYIVTLDDSKQWRAGTRRGLDDADLIALAERIGLKPKE